MNLFKILVILLGLTLQLSYVYAEDDDSDSEEEEVSEFGLFNKDNWNYSGDVGIETRYFPIDDNVERTNELSFDFGSHFKAEFSNDQIYYKFGGLLRMGLVNDARNVALQEENYIKKEWEDAAFTIGYQIHAWNILEGFAVSDIINSRNLDGDYELREKFGELTVSYEILGETYTLGFYYFPKYEDPFWPESQSRMSPVTTNEAIDKSDVASSVWVEDDNTTGDGWGHQWAVKFNDSWEDYNLDLDLYVLHHMDRSQPVLTLAQDFKIRGHHFKVTQYGTNISKVQESWVFKFEGAYRDYDNVRFTPFAGGLTIHPEDHALSAVGVEKAVDIWEGLSSTVFLEWQKVIGVDLDKSEQYDMFQNDVFVALRTDFNDVNGTTLTMAAFVDLEKQYEYALSFEYARRVAEHWKIVIGGRAVDAPEKSAPKGLELFKDSDHIYGKLTTFF